MLGPDFHTPVPPQVNTYTAAKLPTSTTHTHGLKAGAQYFMPGKAVPKKWWYLFKSPKLNALINKGFANNPDLEAAKATLVQAKEALHAQTASALFPNISAQMNANRQRTNNASIGIESPENIFNLYNTSVDITYHLDLSGRSMRTLEALRAQVDYQEFQVQAAYTSLAANIATTAIMAAQFHAQILATRDLIQSQTHIMQIVHRQYQLGAISKTQVLAQQTQLSQTRATLPPLEKSLAQYRNALATLVGAIPSQSHIPTLLLSDFTLPKHLPIGVPSHLTQRRPDVRAAAALLHVASAKVGVAQANRFPQFTLTSSYGYSSNTTHAWLTPQNLVWNLGAGLAQPIFDAGKLRAEKREAVAAFKQSAAHYKATVLVAFQNVADALAAIQVDAKALKTQIIAERAAHSTLVLARKQYQLGATSYITLLDAARQYQTTRITRIQAQAARYADTIALLQALGGGWALQKACRHYEG